MYKAIFRSYYIYILIVRPINMLLLRTKIRCDAPGIRCTLRGDVCKWRRTPPGSWPGAPGEGPGEEQVECVWLTEIRVWIFDAKQINTRAFVLCDWLLFTIGRDYLNWQGRPPIRKKITQRLRSGSAYSLTLALQNYIIFLFSHDIDWIHRRNPPPQSVHCKSRWSRSDQ